MAKAAKPKVAKAKTRDRYFASVDAAVIADTNWLKASSHTVYEYDDDFIVIRYETATGKTVLPYHRKGDVWVNRQPDRPGGLPLYRLADLTDGARAFITESEKACDAATAIGLPFVMASAGGSNSGAVAKTNWSPLAGHPVVILPDYDKPGQKYAKAVATKLHELGCTVKIVHLPDLPPKGVVDVSTPIILEGVSTDDVVVTI